MWHRACHSLRPQRNRLSPQGLPPPARATSISSISSQERRRHPVGTRDSSRRCLVGTSTPPPPPPLPPPRKCLVYNITGGAVPYDRAWLWQQRLLHERMAWQREESQSQDSHDVLLMLEHPPVYTLGRGSSLDHLRFDPTDPSSLGGREVRRTERGGEVTWHGPGQVVGYPVLDLNFHKKDLHWYLRQLEEVVIRVLGRYGLEGERETEHTGVWVGGAKVAAIGLNASRWVTSHGFALNVNPDLSAFEAIVPCGIQGRPVTRLCDLVGAETGSPPPSPEEVEKAARVDGTGVTAANAADNHAVDMGSIRSLVMQEFEGVFGVRIEVVDVDAAAHISGDDDLEREIFPADCEPQLLARLQADSLRQLELTRR
ncbi:unnamed protein product [Ectocarpus sp. 8 AP-2014]